jgi:histidine ammonia-lyase
MKKISLSLKSYSYKDFAPLFQGPIKVSLDKKCKKNIEESNERLIRQVEKGITIYGVNTGFGDLCNIKIKTEDQYTLQANLVKSHASGLGKPLSKGVVRSILILKILTYIKGYSGIRLKLVETIIDFLNNDIIPIIPEKGSVGASGDLAPLAHMALAIIGEGEVFYKGKRVLTKLALKDSNIIPLLLHQKEGLSLINGTQLSTAIGIKCLLDGELILKSMDIAAALSVENSYSSRKVFKKEVHQLKQHPGQQLVARNIYKILFSSEIVKSHSNCLRVQDPYSFRCIPHVHGASRDSFDNASKVINNEINSVSDNPLVLKNEEVISSGHFHAEHIAQNLDFLSISFSELGSISERRIHFMMKGIENKTSPFLALEPGLESGYMIAHVTAASLASENKTLSHPASVDNITTSAGQEDFVSMAPWAGQKLLKIQDNIFNIISIELMVSGAANYISSSINKSGKGSKAILKLLNAICNYKTGDRSLTKEIESIRDIVINGKLYEAVNKEINLE